MQQIDHIRLSPDGERLVILDQSLLPGTARYIELSTASEMYEAIKSLRVRGAPAIGIFAGFAMYVLARGMSRDSYSEFALDVLKLTLGER